MDVNDLVDVERPYTPTVPSAFCPFCMTKTEFDRKSEASAVFFGVRSGETVRDIIVDKKSVVPDSDPDFPWHSFLGWALADGDEPKKRGSILLIPGSVYDPVVGGIEFSPVYESKNIVWGPTTLGKVVAKLNGGDVVPYDLSQLLEDSIRDAAMFDSAVAEGAVKICIDCTSSLVINIGSYPSRSGSMSASLQHGNVTVDLGYAYTATYGSGATPGKDIRYSNTKRLYLPPDHVNIVMSCLSGGCSPRLDVSFVGLVFD